MNPVYKLNVPLQSKEVSEVYRSSGIKRPVDDLDRIQRMIEMLMLPFPHGMEISWLEWQEPLLTSPIAVIYPI